MKPKFKRGDEVHINTNARGYFESFQSFCAVNKIELPIIERYVVVRVDLCKHCGDHFNIVIAGESLPASLNNILNKFAFDEGTFEPIPTTEQLLKALKW